MYLSVKGSGATAAFPSLPMVWSSITPSGFKQLAALREELVVMRRADMLEHADRDDSVELAFDLAVIDQLEFHLVGDAGLLGSLGARS